MARFVNDTFTEGSYTAISSHTGETGATWSLEYGDSTNKGVFASGFLCASGNAAMYSASGTPGGADYEVHVWGTYRGATNFDFTETGPAGRINGSGGNGYAAWWREDAGQIRLARIDAGARNVIGTSTQTTPSVGTAVKLTLRMVGSTIKVLKDDVEVISVTDTTYSAAGKAGIHLRGANQDGNFGAANQGWPANALEAWDVSSADTLAPTVPTGLTLGTRTAGTLPFTWSASTDSGGGVVSGYKIQILDAADSVLSTIDVGLVLAYTITGLNGGTTRKLRVLAYDNASTPNESAYCAAVSGTTLDAMSPSGAAAIATVAAAGTMTMTGTSRQFSMTLYQEDGVTPLAGRTNLWYAWWPSIAAAQTAAASIYGTGASTNGSGQLTFAAPSGLSVGNNQGYGVISDQDATADAAEIAYVGSFDVI